MKDLEQKLQRENRERCNHVRLGKDNQNIIQLKPTELDQITTNTINATLEYVREVISSFPERFHTADKEHLFALIEKDDLLTLLTDNK